MTSSSDIATKFESAIETFTPIVGQPKDNNVQGVQKFLFQMSLSIRLAGLKLGKVTGLVIPDAAYKNQPGVKALFDKNNTPLDEYNPAVNIETKLWEQRKLQALGTPALTNKTASTPPSTDAVSSSFMTSRMSTTSTSMTKTPTKKWFLCSRSLPISPKKLGGSK